MEYITYFTYNGSYTGLLTALHTALLSYKSNIHLIPQSNNNTPELFAEYELITTDSNTASILSQKIKNQISPQAEKNIYLAFLSEQNGIENDIFAYLKWGFSEGKQVDNLLSQPAIKKINNISQKVSRERHRMLGFLRFQKLSSGIYYAAMEPDFNILTLVAPHFKNRLRDQSWIIHDKSREKYALYNKAKLVYTTDSIPQDKLVKHCEEEQFQYMWKKYFQNISIPERQNKKLQQKFLPKKYWKYLTEKE